jgi:hypothetical protein
LGSVCGITQTFETNKIEDLSDWGNESVKKVDVLKEKEKSQKNEFSFPGLPKNSFGGIK